MILSGSLNFGREQPRVVYIDVEYISVKGEEM